MKLREFNPAAAAALVPFWEILLILLGLAATLGVLFFWGANWDCAGVGRFLGRSADFQDGGADPRRKFRFAPDGPAADDGGRGGPGGYG